jgi:hypothetical protein
VYVDDVLIATRLDDGKSYDFDPGKHFIRFVHDGKETTMKAILNQGEKGRTIVATFSEINAASTSAPDARPLPPQPKRPILPLAVAGIGAAAVATGVVLYAVGVHQVPAQCSLSTKECAAPPGDHVFDEASHGASLANLGMGVGLGGAAVLVGGLVWYFIQPPASPSQAASNGVVQPWIGRGSGGLAVSSSF